MHHLCIKLKPRYTMRTNHRGNMLFIVIPGLYPMTLVCRWRVRYMPILRLLYALVVNNISTEYEKNVLFINLPRLMEKTAIRVEDFEKEARNKINCRVEICVIAREYYKSGERNNNLLEWRKLTENMDEFVEIRNIEFE